MFKVVADTSALISLEISNLFEKLLKFVDIYTTPEILAEIEEMSEFKNSEGVAARKLLFLAEKGRIKEARVKNKNTVENLLSPDVDEGEASCFVACMENKINNLIMDDVDAAYSLQRLAKIKNIKIKISVAIIVEMFKKNLITKKQVLKAIKKIIRTREWEGGILEVLAKKYLGRL